MCVFLHVNVVYIVFDVREIQSIHHNRYEDKLIKGSDYLKISDELNHSFYVKKPSD